MRDPTIIITICHSANSTITKRTRLQPQKPRVDVYWNNMSMRVCFLFTLADVFKAYLALNWMRTREISGGSRNGPRSLATSIPANCIKNFNFEAISYLKFYICTLLRVLAKSNTLNHLMSLAWNLIGINCHGTIFGLGTLFHCHWMQHYRGWRLTLGSRSHDCASAGRSNMVRVGVDPEVVVLIVLG